MGFVVVGLTNALLVTPSEPSDIWRSNRAIIRALSILAFGFSWYAVAFIASPFARRCARISGNPSVTSFSKRGAAVVRYLIERVLEPGEKHMWMRSRTPTEACAWSWTDAALMIVWIALSLMVAVQLNVLIDLDGAMLTRQEFALWCSGFVALIVLTVVSKGITWETAVLGGIAVQHVALMRSFPGGVKAAAPLWLQAGIVLVCMPAIMIVFGDLQWRVLVATDRRLALLSPRLWGAPRIQALTGRLHFKADRWGRLEITQTNPPRRWRLLVFVEMLPNLKAVLAQCHPDTTVDFSAVACKTTPPLPRSLWSCLPPIVAPVAAGIWIGDLLFRGLLLSTLLAPHIEPLNAGRPEPMHANARFVLTLLPNDPVALGLGSKAALLLHQDGEADRMAQRVLTLTRGDGKMAAVAADVLKLLRQRERTAEHNRAHSR